VALLAQSEGGLNSTLFYHAYWMLAFLSIRSEVLKGLCFTGTFAVLNEMSYSLGRQKLRPILSPQNSPVENRTSGTL